MSHTANLNCFRNCLVAASLVFAPLAFADIFEPGPFVPPADSVYTVPNTCISIVCLENITLSNFTNIQSKISHGNQLVTADVGLDASIFQNISGAPGKFISPVELDGGIAITYANKATLSEFGTFSDTITSLDLTGSFNGLTGTQTITAALNPNEASTGETTITRITVSPSEFRITSFFDVLAEISVDGGAFVPGPERVAELGPTPEPAYYGAVGLVLAAMLVRRVVRSRQA